MKLKYAAALALLFIAIDLRIALADSPAPTVMPSSLTLSPRELFARTFARLESYPIPPYVVYATLWRIRASSTGHENDVVWRYAIREADGRENSSMLQSDAFLPRADIWQDYGPEYLGLFASILRAPTPGVSPSPDVASGLKVIAVVAATREDYRIDLVGTDKMDGHPTDHLGLTPLRDSAKYNLRDLWIDTQTFDLRKARFIIEHDASDPEWNGAVMTVSFGPALQYWIVMHENWYAVSTLHGGAHTFDVTTLRVAFPPTLPDWLFDQSAYRRHQNAGEPDSLNEILKASRPPA